MCKVKRKRKQWHAILDKDFMFLKKGQLNRRFKGIRKLALRRAGANVARNENESILEY